MGRRTLDTHSLKHSSPFALPGVEPDTEIDADKGGAQSALVSHSHFVDEIDPVQVLSALFHHTSGNQRGKESSRQAADPKQGNCAEKIVIGGRQGEVVGRSDLSNYPDQDQDKREGYAPVPSRDLDLCLEIGGLFGSWMPEEVGNVRDHHRSEEIAGDVAIPEQKDQALVGGQNRPSRRYREIGRA